MAIDLPLISIITPVFNAVKDIENCIQSVLKQDYKNIEHIIIDGNSLDGTIDIIKRYAENNNNIKWISEKDNGIYDAMNKGIDLATGEFLLFLGADDIFYSNDILENIVTSKNIFDNDFIYGKVLFKTKKIVFGKEANLQTLKTENIPHQAILYKKNLFKKLGKYGNTFKVSEDYVFNIKCFKDNTIKKNFIDVIFVTFNDTATSSFLRDGFQKQRLFYFDKLSFLEKIKKYYFYYRPDWFVPSTFIRKLNLRK